MKLSTALGLTGSALVLAGIGSYAYSKLRSKPKPTEIKKVVSEQFELFGSRSTSDFYSTNNYDILNRNYRFELDIANITLSLDLVDDIVHYKIHAVMSPDVDVNQLEVDLVLVQRVFEQLNLLTVFATTHKGKDINQMLEAFNSFSETNLTII